MPEKVKLDLPGAEVYFFPDFLTPAEDAEFFSRLMLEVTWKQESMKMFGKEVKLPRLTSWHASDGLSYSYSGITSLPLPWLPPLTWLREKVEQVCQCSFNSVLLNLYRDGNDSVSWHADDEKELGPDPLIASVSLGAPRRFQFKSRVKPESRREILLTSGCLLFMGLGSQTLWLHQVPKEKMATQARINLTFRCMEM
ncbi:MAG: alpha-ketoglutarate-dependent dioxygenase AlkB [Gemmataceae bacterium]|nr:alpha-ketoglutarate-dependent dioxygenase AlkB [Gemmataceae bacterium]